MVCIESALDTRTIRDLAIRRSARSLSLSELTSPPVLDLIIIWCSSMQKRSAAPPGRYVAGRAAFEPLQRRPAEFHHPDIVESLKCTAGLMSVFCVY
eukprot:COSAG02_NODE_1756_length_11052_cov_5.309230_11_plen_97_part_00